MVTNKFRWMIEIITFAEILARDGYATGYAGKWHLDGGGKPQWGPERKFGFADNRYMFNRGHWKQLEDTPGGTSGEGPQRDGKPTYDVAGADEKSFTTDFLADKTVDFIRLTRDGTVLLHGQPAGSARPRHRASALRHDVRTIRRTSQPRSALKPAEGPPSWGPKQERRVRPDAKYYGMVKCIDDNVGKILAALRAEELIENTIVVFTADHGDLRGEHGRHNKGVPYEGSAKIPFVIYSPARSAGTVIDQALSCVDFLPTILGLMGVPSAGREEGRDASALLSRASS